MVAAIVEKIEFLCKMPTHVVPKEFTVRVGFIGMPSAGYPEHLYRLKVT